MTTYFDDIQEDILGLLNGSNPIKDVAGLNGYDYQPNPYLTLNGYDYQPNPYLTLSDYRTTRFLGQTPEDPVENTKELINSLNRKVEEITSKLNAIAPKLDQVEKLTKEPIKDSWYIKIESMAAAHRVREAILKVEFYVALLNKIKESFYSTPPLASTGIQSAFEILKYYPEVTVSGDKKYYHGGVKSIKVKMAPRGLDCTVPKIQGRIFLGKNAVSNRSYDVFGYVYGFSRNAELELQGAIFDLIESLKAGVDSKDDANLLARASMFANANFNNTEKWKYLISIETANKYSGIHRSSNWDDTKTERGIPDYTGVSVGESASGEDASPAKYLGRELQYYFDSYPYDPFGVFIYAEGYVNHWNAILNKNLYSVYNYDSISAFLKENENNEDFTDITGAISPPRVSKGVYNYISNSQAKKTSLKSVVVIIFNKIKAELLKNYQKTSGEFKSLFDDVRVVSGSISDARKIILEAETAIDSISTESKKAIDENKNTIINLGLEINRLKADITKKSANATSLNNQISNLEEDKSALQADVESHIDEIQLIDQRINKLEGENNDLIRQISNLNSELDRVTIDKNTAESRYIKAESDYKKSQTGITNLKNALKASTNNSIIAAGMYREIENKVNALKATISKQKTEIDGYITSITTLKTEIKKKFTGGDMFKYGAYTALGVGGLYVALLIGSSIYHASKD